MIDKRQEALQRGDAMREDFPEHGEESAFQQMRELNSTNIEYILKIPRSLDHRMAEELNARHKRFVEEEIKRFSLALSNAEHLSSECKPSSRRSHADDPKNI